MVNSNWAVNLLHILPFCTPTISTMLIRWGKGGAERRLKATTDAKILLPVFNCARCTILPYVYDVIHASVGIRTWNLISARAFWNRHFIILRSLAHPTSCERCLGTIFAILCVAIVVALLQAFQTLWNSKIHDFEMGRKGRHPWMHFHLAPSIRTAYHAHDVVSLTS